MSLDAIRARVHALAASGKLDRRLQPRKDGGLPWSEWLWVDGAFALVAGAIVIGRAGMRVADTKQPVAVADVLHAAALLALSGACFLLARWVVPAAERRRRRLLKNGVLVPAAVVQANGRWYSAENTEWQPATILWSAAAGSPADTEDLEQVAAAVSALKHQDRRVMPLEQARLAWDLYHEMGPGPSLPVPPELAHGQSSVRMGAAMLPPRGADDDEDLFVLILPRAGDAGQPLALVPSLLED